MHERTPKGIMCELAAVQAFNTAVGMGGPARPIAGRYKTPGASAVQAGWW